MPLIASEGEGLLERTAVESRAEPSPDDQMRPRKNERGECRGKKNEAEGVELLLNAPKAERRMRGK